jgi:hypothetical protein
MPEADNANIEIARHLNEAAARKEVEHDRVKDMLEIFETIVLALVAVATAWSGYQASRWDGRQSLLYGRSEALRVEAQAIAVRGNDVELYDALTVTEWLKAEAQGNKMLAQIFERRLLPEIRPAFETWKATDPIHSPKAAPGPISMPEYHNIAADNSAKANEESARVFDEGTQAREYADQYVRATVVLGTVLLLAAIGQRFRAIAMRAALIILAFLVLIGPLWHILTLPRG